MKLHTHTFARPPSFPDFDALPPDALLRWCCAGPAILPVDSRLRFRVVSSTTGLPWHPVGLFKVGLHTGGRVSQDTTAGVPCQHCATFHAINFCRWYSSFHSGLLLPNSGSCLLV